MSAGTLRSIALLCLGGLAFLATASLLRAAAPWPKEGALDARMRHFLAHADAYDAVFVGSSNIAHGFDPAELDPELARLGHPLRSYNLGADNMQPSEADFVLRQLTRHRPAHLRWALIELLDFDPTRMLSDNAFSERAVYWHDPRAAADAVRRVLRSAVPLEEKARLVWLHLQHAAWRVSNLGLGQRSVAAWFAPTDPVDAAVAEAGGFEPMDQRPDPPAVTGREHFLANIAGFRARIAGLDEANRRPGGTPLVEARDLRDQAERLAADGIASVYVVPPLARATPALYTIAGQADVPPVLGFNFPARYPELYRVEHRFDATHVNRAGSAWMSRHFAERFAELLDGKRAD